MISIPKLSITAVLVIIGIVLFFYLTSKIFQILLPIILIIIIYFLWKYRGGNKNSSPSPSPKDQKTKK